MMRNRFSQILVLVVTLFQAALAQRADLSGLKFCIDPGHGGYGSNDRHIVPDPGVDFYESESNFQKALLLKSLLEAKGAWVVLTRNSNSGQTYPNPNDPDEPSLPARWQLANENNVNWFHSIHSNATALPLGQNLTTNYTLLLIKEDIPTRQAAWPEAVTMSDMIGPSIQTKLRTSSRSKYTYLDFSFYGGYNDSNLDGKPDGFNLGVLSGLAMPGELSEGSFHDNYGETRRLLNNSYRKMEAYAVRDAFLQYFGAPADALCIVAGILKNTSGAPINGAKVRLFPEDIVYSGDSYSNGFYMFDGVKGGAHTLSFETPNYETASVAVTLEAGKTLFLDKSFMGGAPFTIRYASPAATDTAYPVNQTIALSFSAPMDTASVRQAFSITPALTGTFNWYNPPTAVLFRPDQPFKYSTWYTYRIAATARTVGGGYLDANGDGTAGDDFVINFKTMAAPVSVEKESAIPKFGLAQNYPNPFNPNTAISYQLIANSFVALKVYDLLGREIATLASEMQSAGSHQVRWNGRSDSGEQVSSGMYLYQLRAGSFVMTRKMLLMR